MKAVKLISITLILLLAFLNGCVMVDSNINGEDWDNNTNKIYGSGNIITLSKDYTDFNSIDVQSGFVVKVIKGSEYKVSFEVDDNIAGCINTHQSGKKVYISLASGNSYRNVTLRAIIETPDLENITGNGGVVIEFTGRDFYNNLVLDLNGGSVVKGSLDAASLELKLNGGSIVELTGSGKNLNTVGNGGVILKLYEFLTENCSLSFNGGSIAYINVSETLSVYLTGGSIVKYKGNPSLGSISVNGGSIIQKSN